VITNEFMVSMSILPVENMGMFELSTMPFAGVHVTVVCIILK